MWDSDINPLNHAAPLTNQNNMKNFILLAFICSFVFLFGVEYGTMSQRDKINFILDREATKVRQCYEMIVRYNE